jgi:hypothetical protein
MSSQYIYIYISHFIYDQSAIYDELWVGYDHLKLIHTLELQF